MSYAELTAATFKDRVRDYTQSTGTDAFLLSDSPPTGYSSFGDKFTSGDVLYYCVVDEMGQWATYYGTFDGTSLSRVTFLDSSTGSDIEWSEGSKQIFAVWSANMIEDLIEHTDQLPTQIPILISEGGTEANNAADARANLGLGALAVEDTVGTSLIDDDAVTFDKIQNITDARVLGRANGSAGSMVELTAGVGISIAAGAISSTLTGFTDEAAQDAVGGIVGNTTTINISYSDATPSITAAVNANSISDTLLRDSAALSVIGRAANSTGDPADIAAANDGEVLRRSGTTLGFGTIATAGLANAAVTSAKLRDSAAVSVIGRSANSTGVPADIAAGANDRLLARTSDALSFVQLTVGMVPDATLTYAKLQNVSATSRVLGRKTGGAGVTEELTLSELLDFVGSAVQGDILYKGASGWTRLGAGTSGHFLKTQGPAADPVWAAASGGTGGAWTVIERKTGAGVASYDFTTGVTGYRTLKLIGWLRPATNSVMLWLRTDSSTGASFDAGASDYSWETHNERGGALDDDFDAADAQIVITNDPGAAQRIGSDADQRVSFEITINVASGYLQDANYTYTYEAADDSGTIHGGGSGQRLSTTIADALQLLFSSGNIAAGDVTLYGIANS